MDDSPVEYQCIPAVPEKDSDTDGVPTALVNHEAVALGDSIFFFNGSTPEDVNNLRIWEFKTTTARWRETSLAENSQLAARLASGDRSVLPSKSERVLIASTDEATYVLDQTHDHVDTVYYLDSHTEGAVFKTIRFPSVVEAGEKKLLPDARQGAKLVPVSTGHGRKYLLLLPGISLSSSSNTSEPGQADFAPSTWALQLPSSPSSGAQIKDSTRDKLDEAEVPGSQAVLGGDSGAWSWAEVVIEARNEEMGTEGKSLPGPIAWYGADVVSVSGSEIVIWGGVDPKGEVSGEGWVLKVK